jgi:ACS family allantoate permease-like MFS transporter
MLTSENKRREAEERDHFYDNVYISQQLPDGTKTKKHIDRVCFIER